MVAVAHIGALGQWLVRLVEPRTGDARLGRFVPAGWPWLAIAGILLIFHVLPPGEPLKGNNSRIDLRPGLVGVGQVSLLLAFDHNAILGNEPLEDEALDEPA